MKAWIVDDPIEAASAAVVFAETRGQAKVLAQSTDACEDMAFTDIRAVRAPKLDRFYKGKSEMDWFDHDDRIAMVQYGGFHCSPEVDVYKEKCESCPAHEWCEKFENMMEDTWKI